MTAARPWNRLLWGVEPCPSRRWRGRPLGRSARQGWLQAPVELRQLTKLFRQR
jgi:hypothetical protein